MLRVSDLSISFGGAQVLSGVSLEAAGSSVTSVIGPNGAGKTTLFDALSGHYRPASGRAEVAGRPITHRRPHEIARLGLARTYQTPRLFAGMSVLDNLVIGAPSHGNEAPLAAFLRFRQVAARESAARRRAVEIAERLSLAGVLQLPAAALSGGQRKLVDLGRALMSEAPLLLLDEPVAGVAPQLVESIASTLSWLASAGKAVVVVEHNMDFVMRISATVFVLHQGRIIAAGRPDEVRGNPVVLKAFLGV